MNMQTKEKIKENQSDGLRVVIYNIFCAMIFISPILPEDIGIGLYSLRNTLFNLITIATLVILAIVDIKDRKFKYTIYDFLVGCYLLLGIASSIASKYGFVQCILGTNGRGEGLLTIFSYLVTFTICTKGYPYIKKTFKIALTGAVIVCIYGIIQANVPLDVKLPFGSSQTLGTAKGTMGNQNFLASYICIFLPMMCYYFLNVKEVKSLIIVAILFTTLIFTKTLSCYTVFIIMYILISIFSIWYSTDKKRTVLKLFAMTATIVLVFGLINVIKSDIYMDELNGVKTEVSNLANGDDQFATGRLFIWKKTLLAINNNKLLGVGPDSLKMEFANKQYHSTENRDLLDFHIVDKAHSEYLQIAVTTGIPSLIVYVALLVIICVRLLKMVFKMHIYDTDNENKLFITMTFIGVISYLGQAIGNISVVQVAPIFWTILGLGAGITLNEKIEKTEKTEKTEN